MGRVPLSGRLILTISWVSGENVLTPSLMRSMMPLFLAMDLLTMKYLENQERMLPANHKLNSVTQQMQPSRQCQLPHQKPPRPCNQQPHQPPTTAMTLAVRQMVI